MLKGLKFLLKQVWKYKKNYIIYEILLQLSKLMIPISTIIFPKYIIDELMGKQRLEYLVSFIIGMLSLNFLGVFLQVFLKEKFL